VAVAAVLGAASPTGRASAAPPAAPVVTTSTPTVATTSTTVTCDPARPSVHAFYGPAASLIYDNTFQLSAGIPNIAAGYVPQGMTSWTRNGQTLLILGEYKDGQKSRLIAVDPHTGGIYGQVLVAASHLGGIAIVGDWLFAQDQENANGESVRKYRLSTLAAAFDTSHASGQRTKPYVGRSGALQKLNYWASFMTSDGGYLWAGHHGVHDRTMYRYSVSADGALHRVGGGYEAPKYTDGVVVTADRFIFVSHSRPDVPKGFGTMTVAARSAQRSAGRHCFAMPNLGEGAVLIDGTVYTVFESGVLGSRSPSADHIPYLHRAAYTQLSRLLPS
jgi:hypothetical protein